MPLIDLFYSYILAGKAIVFSTVIMYPWVLDLHVFFFFFFGGGVLVLATLVKVVK